MKSDKSNGSILLDVPLAADYLTVTERFIRRLVDEKRVKYFKVGRYLRFDPADLDKFIQAGRVDPLDEG